jgi:trans-aconitate methyltransferase
MPAVYPPFVQRNRGQMDDNIPMPPIPPHSAQTGDTSRYAADGRFVATLASAVVDLLNPQPGERILDAGCGDGALTQQIAASGATLRGVDSSPAMAAAARARGLEADEFSLTDLPYNSEFDAVFSNAALHWIPVAAQPAALAAIHRALRPGGRFVAEMGGLGNIAAIRTALSAVLAPLGIDAEAQAASFYPSPTHYRALLEAAGFEVQSIDLIPRPTPLPNGPEGMTRWLETFRNGVLDLIPSPAARQQAVTDTVTLLKPILQDAPTQNWTADYVRLRFHATRT